MILFKGLHTIPAIPGNGLVAKLTETFLYLLFFLTGNNKNISNCAVATFQGVDFIANLEFRCLADKVPVTRAISTKPLELIRPE